MRIIFVTPLLWRRLDRAVRRREEGQALILIALAAVAMVAVVGLAVDGGLAYLEAQKLQRAADAAALAGVIWVPNQAAVADGRGKLSAQANGYKVYKDPKNPEVGNNWTYDDVLANVNGNAPGERVMYIGEIPRDNQYRVTLGRMAQRYFLGVIGLGNYYIQRVATAEYSRQVKLGSSFNYLGSTGVLYDPSVNATEDSNDTFGRYVSNRCNKVNPPPNCVGTFWSNIGGTDWVHGNGDAYNPIHDGQYATEDAGGRWSSIRVKTDIKSSKNCAHTTQATSWFVNDNPGANNGLSDTPNAPAGGCLANSTENNPPILNLDIHPDAGNRRNFGYEIGIQVDERALIPSGTVNNHTNVNISIYDAALANVGASNLFGTGDIYNVVPGVWGNAQPQTDPLAGKPSPETTFMLPFQGTNPQLAFYPQRFKLNFDRPYTGTVMPKPTDDQTKYLTNEMSVGICPAPVAEAAAYGPGKFEYNGTSTRRCLTQYWITDTTAPSIVSYNKATSTTLTYGAGQPYRFNEMRTRYTLYWPPKAPGVTSNYANVAFNGNKIGAFEVGDMSLRFNVGNSGAFGYTKYTNYLPIERDTDESGALSGTFVDNFRKNGPRTYSAYCYIVSLNPPLILNKNNPNTNVPSNPVGNENPSDLIAQGKGYNLMDIRPWNDTQFVYACGAGSFTSLPPTSPQFDSTPPNAPGEARTDFVPDYYWGMPFPSSQYPYDALSTGNSDTNKASSGSIATSNYVKDVPLCAGKGYGYAELVYEVEPDPTNPGKCRLKLLPGGKPISSILNNTVVSTWDVAPKTDEQFPFNVKPPLTTNFIDPGQECRISVSSAPGRGTSGGYGGSGASSSPIEPLYQYGSPRMPFNAAYGDRINSYTLSGGKYNVTYFSRHGWRCNWDFDSDYDPRFNPLQPGGTEPLDSSFNGLNEANPKTNNGYSIYGNGKMEPFFHLTDYTWSGNTRVKKPGDPVVRAGTYMLHVQTYGGSGANRYSVKAEYENAQNVTVTTRYDPVTGQTKTRVITPVPNVFGISTFSIYTNAQNTNDYDSDVLFDLAYIPPENAGATAILQLWDPGDVEASLNLSLLEPSKSGNRLDHTTNPPSVAKGNPISVTVLSCPYYLNNISNCKSAPGGTVSSVEMAINNNGAITQHFNDQWVSMVFQIPSRQEFEQYLNACGLADVPEEACYYFQVDYRLGKGIGNDTTTWQLVVQGAPVRLLR